MKDLRKQPLAVMVNTAMEKVLGSFPSSDAEPIATTPDNCDKVADEIKLQLGVKLECENAVIETMLAGFSIGASSTMADIVNEILAKYLAYPIVGSRVLMNR